MMFWTFLLSYIYYPLMEPKKRRQPQFFPSDAKKILQEVGKQKALELLQKMLLIRNFETRAEAAYQHGKIGGFFHSYIGQEAIQVAAYHVFGPKNWWTTTYRCHALALLLEATPNELMAELFGRATGNAKGRGGSMHLYTERMLGGFAIVGGHLPVAAGAAFALKYQEIQDEISICFLGDGAIAQGAFHEALNLASLWDLPCLYIIENNQWGMGTSVERAIAAERLAEDVAPAYGLKGYTFNGMDLMNSIAALQEAKQEMKKSGRPILMEAVTERFKGHSVSDPGLYRTKEELKEAMERDPILFLQEILEEAGWIDDASFKEMDLVEREKVIAALQYAESSPWPDPITLEEDVYAPR